MKRTDQRASELVDRVNAALERGDRDDLELLLRECVSVLAVCSQRIASDFSVMKRAGLKGGDEAKSRRQEYLDYLDSAKWKAKRKEAFAAYGRRCQRCEADDRELHVHHKTYKRLFDEAIEDLEVLCFACHAKEHAKVKSSKVRRASKTKKPQNGWLKQFKEQEERRLNARRAPVSSWDRLQVKYEQRRAEKRAARESA